MKKITLAITLVVMFSLAFAVTPASACGCTCECCPGVGSPGYWKNHPEAWPVSEIMIGGVTYTVEEAIAWMDMPVKNDKSITMFKAVVAAELNVLMNCGCCEAYYWIDEGQWWLGAFPVGSGVVAKSEAWQASHGEMIYWKLDMFNNGMLCYGARE